MLASNAGFQDGAKQLHCLSSEDSRKQYWGSQIWLDWRKSSPKANLGPDRLAELISGFNDADANKLCNLFSAIFIFSYVNFCAHINPLINNFIIC